MTHSHGNEHNICSATEHGEAAEAEAAGSCSTSAFKYSTGSAQRGDAVPSCVSALATPRVPSLDSISNKGSIPVQSRRSSATLTRASAPPSSFPSSSSAAAAGTAVSGGTIGVQVSVYAIPMFKASQSRVRYAYIPVRHGPPDGEGAEQEYDDEEEEQAALAVEEGASDPLAAMQTPATGKSSGCSRASAPAMQRPAVGSSRGRAASAMLQRRSMPASPSPSMLGSIQQSVARATVQAQVTWDGWGDLGQGTWLRWLHDKGQAAIEDVSPEARLARGISSRATKVTVYHPDCLSRQEAHQQLNDIVAVRGKSELWRMVGNMALFPVGLVIDNTVLVALPAPIATGYSTYKAYMYYKGARGSWRMQHLIRGYEEDQRNGSGCRAGAATGPIEQARRRSSGAGIWAGAGAGEQMPQAGSPPGGWAGAGAGEQVPQAGSPPGVSMSSSAGGRWDRAGEGGGAPAADTGQCSSSSSSGIAWSPLASQYGSAPTGTWSGRLADEAAAASGGRAAAAGGGSRLSHPGVPGGVGRGGPAEGVLGSGLCSADDEEFVEDARPSCAGQQGLEYVMMPDLSRFVSELLQARDGDNGGVLPEEAAAQLCALLPSQHRSEVARHMAELRRRHVRQQAAAARSAGAAQRPAPALAAKLLAKQSQKLSTLSTLSRWPLMLEEHELEPSPVPPGPGTGSEVEAAEPEREPEREPEGEPDIAVDRTEGQRDFVAAASCEMPVRHPLSD